MKNKIENMPWKCHSWNGC